MYRLEQKERFGVGECQHIYIFLGYTGPNNRAQQPNLVKHEYVCTQQYYFCSTVLQNRRVVRDKERGVVNHGKCFKWESVLID